MKKISLPLIFSFFAICVAFGQVPNGNPDLLKGNIFVPDFRFSADTISQIHLYNNQGSIHWDGSNSFTDKYFYFYDSPIENRIVNKEIFREAPSIDYFEAYGLLCNWKRQNLVNQNWAKALLP